MDTLARIEVSQPGHGSYYIPVTQWPVRVGRSLDNDIVLDDLHVAAHHLSLLESTAEGLSIQVLETFNGARIEHQYYARQAHIRLPHKHAPMEITVGRTTLRVRTFFHPLEPEVLLHNLYQANPISIGCLLLGLVAGAHLLGQYTATIESSHFWRKLPETSLGIPLLYMGWAGVWALLCRLFAQPLHFWRHISLVCGIYLATEIVEIAMRFIGFSFSWGWLEAWAKVPVGVLFTWLIFKHLSLVAPARRRVLMAICSLLYVMGLGVSLQQQYAKTYRLTEKLYASSLFPTSMEVVSPVALDAFSRELKAELLPKLEADLLRKTVDSSADD